MKAIAIISKLEELKRLNMRVASQGLKITIAGETSFVPSLDELIEAVKNVDTTNLYRFNFKSSDFMFLSVAVDVEYLTEREAKYPLKLVRIARNLKALRLSDYERSDVSKTYQFYSELKLKLDKRLEVLRNDEMDIVNLLAS